MIHSDTWKPSVFGGAPSDTAAINHGTYFYHAAQEGLIANGTSIHAGIRTTLSGPSDYDKWVKSASQDSAPDCSRGFSLSSLSDADCGFKLVEARAIDTIGTAGIIAAIRETVGDTPCYLSIDIDVLDPSVRLPLVSCTSHFSYSLFLLSLFSGCTRYWNSRDRRMVDSRTSNDHSRTWRFINRRSWCRRSSHALRFSSWTYCSSCCWCYLWSDEFDGQTRTFDCINLKNARSQQFQNLIVSHWEFQSVIHTFMIRSNSNSRPPSLKSFTLLSSWR